ncbi:MAG TPA: hypothetical protein VGD66_13430 [Allosphingosinicella sp.]|jgi:hypothetical protein
MSAAGKVTSRVVAIKAPQGGRIELDLDLSAIRWHDGRGLGAAGPDPRALDLLEIARLVWEVERYTPKRVSSERVRTVNVEMPLRAPDAWTEPAHQALVGMLRLLGNAEWRFEFTKRAGRTALDDLGGGKAGVGESDTVMLFSGGLDSTCGLGWLKKNGVEAVLASFYGAKTKQEAIAAQFRIGRHVQVGCTWDNGRRRFGGQFQYRSFMFLALGAVLARSLGAKTLLQFENGPLSIAIPPSPTYRMTRHAHPKLHRLAETLFSILFGSPLEVANPFLSSTKRQMAELLRGEIGRKEFDAVVRRTETCWNLTSRQVIGKIAKKPGIACGLCVPCVVRRTAVLGNDVQHAVDLTSRKDPHFKDPNARVHVDAYLGWSNALTGPGYDLNRFAFEAPQVVREAVSNSAGMLTMDTTFDLCRTFAQELIGAFPRP